ncbi:MAG: FAD-dependent oxidoreductase, partial [Actinobacteria bacterium]|nr:FAD-dependent oxidoreductase [Actinomycetota bacterium]
MAEEVKLPQLGESVTEGVITAWLVEVGDEVSEDQPLVEISTDKVDTEIPSPVAGTVQELRAEVDDTVEVGQVIAIVGQGEAPSGDGGEAKDAGEAEEPSDAGAADAERQSDEAARAEQAGADYERAPVSAGRSADGKPSGGRIDRGEHEFDVVILGAGTGGYSAALRAAQLGLDVALIEKEKVGGTCLHWGCIPTKAILQTAEVAEHAQDAADFGVNLTYEGIEVKALNQHKDGVVDKMWKGLQGALKGRGVETIHGTGTIKDAHTIEVETEDGSRT